MCFLLVFIIWWAKPEIVYYFSSNLRNTMSMSSQIHYDVYVRSFFCRRREKKRKENGIGDTVV